MSVSATSEVHTPLDTPATEYAEPHRERASEEREAYEYWGYLFKEDKTGTEKLKSLLRGLKDVMNQQYETSDNPDLTPNQLAYFYRELHGNYDQLFLGTPSESIAFIYKSLGCLHSLQPQAFNHSTAFTDPTVPALKTQGWTMWQTIQLLLGPDEHAGFLCEAVQKWDVKDPVTGEVFPKILPRDCFPMEPDKHMVAWYEGVSERLRREAEDEDRHRPSEAEQAEVRRLRDGSRRDETDDEGSIDSKGPAMAYFRNPLYRHVDGRPGIVRLNSKRPALSPRPTMKNKGKEAATTMGHVIRNIGSPNLWDGPSKKQSASRERRRRSLPDHRHTHSHSSSNAPSVGGYDVGVPSPNDHRYRKRPTSQVERPNTASADDEYEASETSPTYSAQPSPRPSSRHRHHHHHRPEGETSLRHSRSHDPTPTQKIDHDDYFAGYDYDPQARRASVQGGITPPRSTADDDRSIPIVGGGFGPSASPLFATHIARQPLQPAMPPPPDHRHHHSRNIPFTRSTKEEPYLRGLADTERRSERRYESPQRRSARFDPDPVDRDDDDGSINDNLPERRRHEGRPSSRSTTDMASYASGGDGGRRHARLSESEVSAQSGAEGDAKRPGRSKTARFANAPVSGVAGRRYLNESPWR